MEPINVSQTKSPRWWVPTLYFAEGVPYALVNYISVALFARMGVPNDQLAFFTTLLYFPWFLKGLWSPFIDVVKTKRWWVIAMQILMTVLCALLIVSIPHPVPELIAAKQTPVSLFWFTLVIFIVTAFASATHDIAADGYYMLAQTPDSQARFIGIRSTFYRLALIFGQGVLIALAGIIEAKTDSVPLAWQITLAATAVILCLITLYHIWAMPKVEEKMPNDHQDQQTFHAIIDAFKTFFTKPGIWLAILFMLLYRFPEGLLVKMMYPFLLDSSEVIIRDGQIIGGGLGMKLVHVGLIYGVGGVVFLLLGGILGGWYIYRHGLKRSLWVMAAFLTLPNLVYVYLSAVQPTNLLVISSAICLEEFGYGFGFTAYMMYMMFIARGEYQTSHYAICTAFMALSMMIPGFIAGKLEMAVGYNTFFWIAIACSVTTILATFLVRRQVDDNYGRKLPNND